MRSFSSPTQSWSRAVVVGLVVAGALLPASVAQAQERRGLVAGTVRDSTGAPIPGVQVSTEGHLIVRSDSLGRFRVFADRGSVDVHFRRLGYEARTIPADLTVDSVATLAVVLHALPHELEGVRVSAEDDPFLADFWARKKSGFGYFITRADILDRKPHAITDLMRTVPGARIIPSGGRSLLRFARSTGGHDCPPQVFVDGVMAHAMEVDEMIPEDVEGIEIYEGASTIPPQFNSRMGTSMCGVVVIWSRSPGT